MSNIRHQGEAGRVAVAVRRADGAGTTLRLTGESPRPEPVSTPFGATEGGVERLCIEHGLKMTGPRRTIARVLSQSSDHPDVEELYRRAVLLDPRISIATVYRTVRLLEEKGILQRRDFGSGRARYEPAEHGPHYHIIDVETGKVIEFKNLEHERLVRALVEQLGFEVISLRLEVFARPLGGDRVPGLTERRANAESR